MKALDSKKNNFFKNLLIRFKKIFPFFIMGLPLFMMDIITRMFGYNIDICNLFYYTPNAFTICWLVFFLNFSINLNNKLGKKIYLIINICFFIIFLVQIFYYSSTNIFFNFHLLNSVGEGLPYILYVIMNSNILVYLSSIIIIILIFLGYKSIPKNEKNNYVSLSLIVVWCLVLHFITILSLGTAFNSLKHNTWLNPKNIYNSFNDSNKSMKLCGLFEYTIRDFYITFLKGDEKETPEVRFFLDDAFKEIGDYNTSFSSIFKDKNLIFVQLEGIDDWVISRETTPTLYKMMDNSFNFNNHYSYYNGGGSTFNSEFAVNTGFITPVSFIKNAYSFSTNHFPNSMARLFKNEGYTVNAFHMNTGEYYSRNNNYKNWGYDNYYGLIDVSKYEDYSYVFDRELILNKEFDKLMFPSDSKFVNYIITFSTHMPFSTTGGICRELYKLDNRKLDENVSEETCVKRQAKETDYMMELLLKKLEEKNLIDDTVIVVFTDHYLYTLENTSILAKYKDIMTNLINHTPFFIWSNDMDGINIDEVTSQIDILPTVLNLFGLYDNPNNYIGKDALNPNYKGIVFFNDYSWYDGNVYVADGKIKNNKDISNTSLNEKNNYINYIIKKNDLALKFDYFK